MLDEVGRQLRAHAGVETVALASGVAYGRAQQTHAYIRLPGAREEDQLHAALVASTSDIFAALGTPVVRGRAFDARDSVSSQPVVVLGDLAAERLFGAADAIGRQIQFTRQRASDEPDQPVKTLTVIGVVDDRGADDPRAAERAYLPLTQHHETRLSVIARTSGDPRDLVAPLRDAITRVDPAMAIVTTGTALQLARPEVALQRVTAGLTAGLGVFALGLALTGLFGILAHVVRRRTREIGLRLALGATPAGIVDRVVREGMRPVLIGVIVGIALGLLIRMASRPLFQGIVPELDLWPLVVVPIPMMMAGLLACYLPARRASRVDPNEALRDL